ncbi:Permease of the drug/metabolite transporter (DMT) superfamily [Actinopolyspora mzabensis]|uniref:Permease of the drug/metabolite transporter (DMT) superfamily n=1 Tax=Actinopolyspora mzabensis TaxID=995066 RepID=A0A1G9FR61_ACTMZ|nr:DMT family transporter [Actinopolyspora mzabensis]SDK90847.1 Permease of the drug/metabolite transporter (DMT) superfamily [Actinopolyspora mzabensis]
MELRSKYAFGSRAARQNDNRGVIFSDISILMVAVIWGSSYVVMQIVGEALPVMAFLALRFLMSIPVIAVLGWRSLRSLSGQEIGTGAWFGFLLFLVLVCETTGVRFTSAANAGFLITVSVVLIPLFELVLFSRRYPALVYVATVAAIVGCGLLSLAHGFRPQLGDLIILAAALVRGFQITLFGNSSRVVGQSLTNITFVEFVVVFTLAGAASFVFEHNAWSSMQGIGIEEWILIAYLGVLGTSFAFFVQLRSARITSSTRVGIILSTEPIFAAMFAIVVANEQLTVLQYIGGALVVIAAFVGRIMTNSPKASSNEGSQSSSRFVQESKVNGGG